MRNRRERISLKSGWTGFDFSRVRGNSLGQTLYLVWDSQMLRSDASVVKKNIAELCATILVAEAREWVIAHGVVLQRCMFNERGLSFL
jgi:hypothetical protein